MVCSKSVGSSWLGGPCDGSRGKLTQPVVGRAQWPQGGGNEHHTPGHKGVATTIAKGQTNRGGWGHGGNALHVGPPAREYEGEGARESPMGQSNQVLGPPSGGERGGIGWARGRGGAPPSPQEKWSVGFSGGSQWAPMGSHGSPVGPHGSPWVLRGFSVGTQTVHFWVLRWPSGRHLPSDKGGGPSDNPGTGNNGIPEGAEGEETLHIWRLAHTQAPAGTGGHAGTSAYGRNRAHTNEWGGHAANEEKDKPLHFRANHFYWID